MCALNLHKTLGFDLTFSAFTKFSLNKVYQKQNLNYRKGREFRGKKLLRNYFCGVCFCVFAIIHKNEFHKFHFQENCRFAQINYCDYYYYYYYYCSTFFFDTYNFLHNVIDMEISKLGPRSFKNFSWTKI